MTKLLLHPRTQEQLDGLRQRWPQALIIRGQDGVGKKTAIIELIARQHGASATQILNNNWSQLMIVTPPDKRRTIGVEQIRELNQFLTLKDDQVRYIIIDEAERMTVPAQNAFLKNFEESQSNVRIVLVTAQPQSLLPTIHSRAQQVAFQSPSRDNLLKWAQQRFGADFNSAMLHVAEGSPGRLDALLGNSKQAKRAMDEIDTARRILGATISERLSMIGKLKSDRSKAVRIITYLKIMTASAMRHLEGAAEIEAWAERGQLCLTALDMLKRNANTRLVWLQLMVNL